MTGLGFAVAFAWLALLTLAAVGLNIRLTLTRQRVDDLRGAPVSSSAPAANAPRNAAVLVVSETCLGCESAIDALEGVAATALGDARGDDGAATPGPLDLGVERYVVLSPDPRDRRMAGRSHLDLLADDDLYRRLHPGTTPALVVTDSTGAAVLARPTVTTAELLAGLHDASADLLAARPTDGHRPTPDRQGGF